MYVCWVQFSCVVDDVSFNNPAHELCVCHNVLSSCYHCHHPHRLVIIIIIIIIWSSWSFSSSYITRSCGFRHINISNNAIGNEGIAQLSIAIARTYSLKTVRVDNCGFNDDDDGGGGVVALIKALAENSTVRDVYVSGNYISMENQNRCLVSVYNDVILMIINR